MDGQHWISSSSDYDQLHESKINIEKMLCAVMQRLSKDEQKKAQRDIPGLKAWWIEHQKKDKERLEEEMREAEENNDRESLLSKLTPYEKKLLKLE